MLAPPSYYEEGLLGAARGRLWKTMDDRLWWTYGGRVRYVSRHRGGIRPVVTCDLVVVFYIIVNLFLQFIVKFYFFKKKGQETTRRSCIIL